MTKCGAQRCDREAKYNHNGIPICEFHASDIIGLNKIEREWKEEKLREENESLKKRIKELEEQLASLVTRTEKY